MSKPGQHQPRRPAGTPAGGQFAPTNRPEATGIELVDDDLVEGATIAMPKLIELPNGTKQWWVDGVIHRTDGPAVEFASGTKEWWVDSKRHRTDGPAIERADGSKQWWLDGRRHRTDGPAIERADGTKEWWLNGRRSAPPATNDTGVPAP